MLKLRRLVTNATLSVIQTVISGVALFVLYRYLIVQLGADQLGLWSVVLASTSVARLSEMGLTGSVVKFVARYRALKDDVQAASVVETAAISIGCVMALLLLALYPLVVGMLSLAIPEKSMAQAMVILPWAVFSLWLANVGAVFQSGLDGCQRIDLRNILMMVGNVFFVVSALWLVPHFGLMGLAIGQTMQSLLLMLASWFVLRRLLPTLPNLPIYWSKAKFKEMFGYSACFQINSIAIMLFDPVIKMLMSRYGGLSSAAYYEMANQLVTKLRALIIAANQALVPAVAELHETTPEKVRDVYLMAYRIVFFVTVPLYAAVWISLPMISELWIGQIEAQFLLFGSLLIVGWGCNTLMSPAYFINLGTGGLKWNSISHVAMAALNVFLGLILGSMYGALGVIVSVMIALVFASCLVIYFLHKQYKIQFWMVTPKEHYVLCVAVLSSVGLASLINSSHFFEHRVLLSGLVSLVIFLTLLCGVIWFHPYKTLLLDWSSRSRDKN